MGKPKNHHPTSITAPLSYWYNIFKVRDLKYGTVQLLELYFELGGKPIRCSTLISSICEQDEDLIVLSSPGYRSLIFFRDNTVTTLKMTKDDEEDDNLEAALNLVAKQIKKECSEITLMQ